MKQAVPISEQAVYKEPEMIQEAPAELAATVYALCGAIVQFQTQLGNISYCARGGGKWKADREGGTRMQVRKEREVLWLFLWVHGFLLGLYLFSGSHYVFPFGFMVYICGYIWLSFELC